MPKLPERAVDAMRVLGLGLLLFAGKRAHHVLYPDVPPPLVVEVEQAASAADVEHAIELALLADLAVKHGAVQADPVVREALLRSMRQLSGNAASEESSLLDQAAELGLFQADPVVRERLRFVGEELLLSAVGDDAANTATLRAYARAHAARYTPPSLTSIVLVVLRGTDAQSRARAVLSKLGTLPVAQSSAFHEEPALPSLLRGATSESLAQRLGEAARAGIDATPTGSWSQPLATPYGTLLAFVQSRSESALPDLPQIAARVAADYQHDTRAERRLSALRKLQEVRGVLVQRKAP
jgi:hypothetical protein